jgi:hypothetical protein
MVPFDELRSGSAHHERKLMRLVSKSVPFVSETVTMWIVSGRKMFRSAAITANFLDR